MTARESTDRQTADKLYNQYGQPLEETHAGQYVAISKDGKTIVGPTMLEVMQKAKASFGPGNYVFRVGQRAVGKWR